MLRSSSPFPFLVLATLVVGTAACTSKSPPTAEDAPTPKTAVVEVAEAHEWDVVGDVAEALRDLELDPWDRPEVVGAGRRQRLAGILVVVGEEPAPAGAHDGRHQEELRRSGSCHGAIAARPGNTVQGADERNRSGAAIRAKLPPFAELLGVLEAVDPSWAKTLALHAPLRRSPRGPRARRRGGELRGSSCTPQRETRTLLMGACRSRRSRGEDEFPVRNAGANRRVALPG